MQFLSDGSFSAIVEREAEKLDSDRFLLSCPSQQEVLLRVHHLLEIGWCKGRYHLTPEEQSQKPKYGFVEDWLDTAHDRYCVTGAIQQAAIDVGYQGNIAAIIKRIRVASQIEVPISIWNDQPHRTKAEILSAIDRAICLTTPNL